MNLRITVIHARNIMVVRYNGVKTFHRKIPLESTML